MTKITHGSLTVTNSLTEAHVFDTYAQAGQWASSQDNLPLTYRIEDRTNPVTGELAATICLPGISNQWVAMPDELEARVRSQADTIAVLLADNQRLTRQLEAMLVGPEWMARYPDGTNLLDMVDRAETDEPDNSDEEPDQLR